MRLKITLLIVLITCTCLGQNKESEEVEKEIPWHEYSISMIKLIATPEKFDGKPIQVIGYLNLEFEGNAIYLHKEDYEKSISRNAMWVNFSEKISSENDLNSFSGKYVIIAGIFRMDSRGHMGMFGGKIENITRLDLWAEK